jgi:hypothetical protein
MLPHPGATGRGRGRGRGSNFTGASNTRAATPRGQSTPRASFGSATRGSAAGAMRGGNHLSKSNGFNKPSARGGRGALASSSQTQGSWQQRFDKVCLPQTCLD